MHMTHATHTTGRTHCALAQHAPHESMHTRHAVPPSCTTRSTEPSDARDPTATWRLGDDESSSLGGKLGRML